VICGYIRTGVRFPPPPPFFIFRKSLKINSKCMKYRHFCASSYPNNTEYRSITYDNRGHNLVIQQLSSLFLDTTEPPRGCRTQNYVRDYRYGKIKQVFTGGSGTGRADGSRAPGREQFPVGGRSWKKRFDQLLTRGQLSSNQDLGPLSRSSFKRCNESERTAWF